MTMDRDLIDTHDVVEQHTLADVARRLTRIEELMKILPILLAGAGVDPTHVSISTAAQILGVSVPTIRRKIRQGRLQLEVIPGTKVSGIAISSVYEQWIPIRVARAAHTRELVSAEKASAVRGATRKVRG